jgi:hypothetical protein
MTIKFERDHIGMVDWAFLPDSIFALARFQLSGRIFLVANARTPSWPEGKFIPMENPKYDYADSYADFKELANEFEGDGKET